MPAYSLSDDALLSLQRSLAKKLGAQQAYLVCAPACDALLAEFVAQPVLADAGLVLANLSKLRARAEASGELLVVDNSTLTCAVCAAVRLGAQLSFEPFGDELLLLGLSRDVSVCMPELSRSIEAVQRKQPPSAEQLSCAQEYAKALDTCARIRNDHAAVVARYLSCHPQTDRCFYPGLAYHPSRALASTMLTGGFGPYIDFSLRHFDSASAAQLVDTVCVAAQKQISKHRQGAAYKQALNAATCAMSLELKEQSDEFGLFAAGVHYIRYSAGTGDVRGEISVLEQALVSWTRR